MTRSPVAAIPQWCSSGLSMPAIVTIAASPSDRAPSLGSARGRGPRARHVAKDRSEPSRPVTPEGLELLHEPVCRRSPDDQELVAAVPDGERTRDRSELGGESRKEGIAALHVEGVVPGTEVDEIQEGDVDLLASEPWQCGPKRDDSPQVREEWEACPSLWSRTYVGRVTPTMVLVAELLFDRADWCLAMAAKTVPPGRIPRDAAHDDRHDRVIVGEPTPVLQIRTSRWIPSGRH